MFAVLPTVMFDEAAATKLTFVLFVTMICNSVSLAGMLPTVYVALLLNTSMSWLVGVVRVGVQFVGVFHAWPLVVWFHTYTKLLFLNV